MHPNTVKSTVSVGWVLAVSATGLLANVTSPSGWLVLAGCSIVPPLLMMYYSKQPAPTMSESIQQALK